MHSEGQGQRGTHDIADAHGIADPTSTPTATPTLSPGDASPSPSTSHTSAADVSFNMRDSPPGCHSKPSYAVRLAPVTCGNME